MSKLVKVIVEEREQRLKELMLMMGLHPGLSRLRAGGGGWQQDSTQQPSSSLLCGGNLNDHQ